MRRLNASGGIFADCLTSPGPVGLTDDDPDWPAAVVPGALFLTVASCYGNTVPTLVAEGPSAPNPLTVNGTGVAAGGGLPGVTFFIGYRFVTPAEVAAGSVQVRLHTSTHTPCAFASALLAGVYSVPSAPAYAQGLWLPSAPGAPVDRDGLLVGWAYAHDGGFTGEWWATGLPPIPLPSRRNSYRPYDLSADGILLAGGGGIASSGSPGKELFTAAFALRPAPSALPGTDPIPFNDTDNVVATQAIAWTLPFTERVHLGEPEVHTSPVVAGGPRIAPVPLPDIPP